MDPIRKQALHSRQNSESVTPIPHPEPRTSKQPSPDPQSTTFKQNVHYTVFIRLPFPRNGFEDPPPFHWDTTKDKALWELISKASTSKELDWEDMSVKFEVSLPFLLQQAAWLYERHFEGMRAQMKKLGVSGTPGPSASPQPVQGEGGGSAFAVGGVGMVRTGSKDSKAPPAIFTQKTSPLPTGEASSPTTPRFNRPEASRTPSTNTVTQSRVFTSSPRPPSQPIGRPSTSSKRRAPRPEQMHDSSQDEDDNSGLGHDGASESESEEEPSAMARSQAFRRSQLSKKPVMSTLSSDGDAEDDDDDDDSGGYLPFAASSKNTKDDPAATLRNSPRQQTAVPQQPSVSKGKSKEQPPDSSTSVSSNSSAQQTPSNNDHADSNNRPGPLSPRHRTELEKLSPRYKKSGSEGSPSMGSSFSDLDDASVTKSALEDALLSNMQHGSIGMGMGSRISTMRDALGRK